MLILKSIPLHLEHVQRSATEAIAWNVIFADYVEEIDLLSYVTY